MDTGSGWRGIFLAGLSLGYGVFGALMRRIVARAAGQGRRPRLLRIYAGIEGAIGLYALVFPALFGAARLGSLAISFGSGGLGPVDRAAFVERPLDGSGLDPIDSRSS